MGARREHQGGWASPPRLLHHSWTPVLFGVADYALRAPGGLRRMGWGTGVVGYLNPNPVSPGPVPALNSSNPKTVSERASCGCKRRPVSVPWAIRALARPARGHLPSRAGVLHFVRERYGRDPGTSLPGYLPCWFRLRARHSRSGCLRHWQLCACEWGGPPGSSATSTRIQSAPGLFRR